MESYKALVFLHVAVIIVGFGSTFAFPFIQAAGERSGVGGTRLAMQIMQRSMRFLVIPAAILTPVLGVGLIFDDVTGYSDDFPAWLMASITWYVVAVAVWAAVLMGGVAKALNTLDGVPDGPALPAAYAPIGKRMQIVGGLVGLSYIGIAFLMIWKPGE